jgi:hypothetical protein
MFPTHIGELHVKSSEVQPKYGHLGHGQLKRANLVMFGSRYHRSEVTERKSFQA